MPTPKYRYVVKYLTSTGKPGRYYTLARDEDHAVAKWYLSDCAVNAKYVSVHWRT